MVNYFFCFLFLLVSSCTAFITEDEATAIAAIYTGLGGTGWVTTTGWDSTDYSVGWHQTVDPCQFHGVTCVMTSTVETAAAQGLGVCSHVHQDGRYECALTSQVPSLDGTSIPSSLVVDATIVALDLSANSLAGSIPTEIGLLTNLESLNLGTVAIERDGIMRSFESQPTTPNFIVGGLPDEMASLTKLKELLLSSQPGMSGSIPSWINDLTALEEIRLNECGFSGELPDISALVNLHSFDIRAVPVSGDIETLLSGKTKLTHINLQDSLVYGELGEWFTDLTDLTDLIINNNAISGSMPSTISNLKHLRALSFGLTSQEGPLPSEISNMISLTWFVSFGYWGGEIVSEVISPWLLAFLISKAEFTGPFPDWVGRKAGLSILLLDENHLSGEIDEAIFEEYLISQTSYNREQLVTVTDKMCQRIAGDNADMSMSAETCATLTDTEQLVRCNLCLVNNPEITTFAECLQEWVVVEVLAPWHTDSYTKLQTAKAGELQIKLETTKSTLEAFGMEALVGGAATGFDIPVSESVCFFLDEEPRRSLLSNPHVISPPSEKSACLTCTLLPGVTLGECLTANQLPVSPRDQNAWDYTRLSIEATTALDSIFESLSALGLTGSLTSSSEIMGQSDLCVYMASPDITSSLPSDWDISTFCSTCPTTTTLNECVVGNLAAIRGMSDEAGLFTGTDIMFTAPYFKSQILKGFLQLDLWVYFASGGTYTKFYDLPGQDALCDSIPDETMKDACNQCPGSLSPLFTVGNCVLQTVLEDENPFIVFSIREFALTANSISGPVPAIAAQLPQITDFLISGCQFTGTIPDLSSATTLTSLNLSDNDLEGEIPETLCQLPNMQTLRLKNNRLSGEIPACLGDLSELNLVLLGGNELTGTIPSELGQLSKLSQLRIDRNQIHGTVPSSFGNLLNLQLLDLSDNQIEGSISSLFGTFATAVELVKWNMANNKITGGLNAQDVFHPQEGILYSKLLEINFSYNELTGFCPETLTALPALANLDFSNNQLTGACKSNFGDFDTFLVHNNLLSDPSDSIPIFLQITDQFVTSEGPPGYPEVLCPVLDGINKPVHAKIDPSYYDWAHCKCQAGFFGTKSRCQPCLEHGTCDDGELLITKGFFPVPDQTSPELLIECFPVGRDQTSCNNDNDVDWECLDGYEGRLCSKCSSGYFPRARKCIECLDALPEILMIVFMLLVFGLYSSLLFRVQKIMLSMVTVTSFLDFLQGSSIIFSQDVFSWTDTSLSLNSVYRYSTVNLSIFACVSESGMSSFNRSLYISLAPVVFGLISVIVYYAGKLRKVQRAFWFEQVFGPLLTMLNFLYVPILVTSLRNLQCDEDATPGSDKTYLHFAPYEECDMSGDYGSLFALAIFCLVVWGAGIPIITGVVLYKIKDNLDDDRTLVLCFNLIRPFKKNLFFFRMPSFARRFFVVVALTAFGETSAVPFILFLIIGIGIWLQVFFVPYKSRLNNTLETAQLSIVLFTFVAGLIFSSDRLGQNVEFLDALILLSHSILIAVFIAVATNVWFPWFHHFPGLIDKFRKLGEKKIVPDALENASNSSEDDLSAFTRTSASNLQLLSDAAPPSNQGEVEASPASPGHFKKMHKHKGSEKVKGESAQSIQSYGSLSSVGSMQSIGDLTRQRSTEPPVVTEPTIQEELESTASPQLGGQKEPPLPSTPEPMPPQEPQESV